MSAPLRHPIYTTQPHASLSKPVVQRPLQFTRRSPGNKFALTEQTTILRPFKGQTIRYGIPANPLRCAQSGLHSRALDSATRHPSEAYGRPQFLYPRHGSRVRPPYEQRRSLATYQATASVPSVTQCSAGAFHRPENVTRHILEQHSTRAVVHTWGVLTRP